MDKFPPEHSGGGHIARGVTNAALDPKPSIDPHGGKSDIGLVDRDDMAEALYGTPGGKYILIGRARDRFKVLFRARDIRADNEVACRQLDHHALMAGRVQHLNAAVSDHVIVALLPRSSAM